MFLENNIRFEAAMLPFLVILTLFLFIRHATSTELNRRLRMLSLTTLLATAAGIATHVSVAEGILAGFPQVLLITVYFAIVNVNGWYLLRYVATYVEFRNTRFLFFCRLVLYASFAVLIANLPTGFFFSSDASGALVKGTWYTLFHAGFTFFFIGTAFALKNIYQQFYENAQFILTNLLMFLLLDAFIIQYLFMENILIVYVVSTALLFLTFFYLEAPSLRKLSATEKQLQEAVSERAHAIEKINAASHAKGAFLANTSHEIRTPMNAILGMNDIIIKQAKDEETLSYARNIRSAGINLLGIINNILDIAKMEAGRMEIYPVDFFLSEVIDDVAAGARERAAEKGLAFELIVNRELPEHLHGDEDAFRRILYNLLDNALKYTENGTITMQVLGGEDAADFFAEQEEEADAQAADGPGTEGAGSGRADAAEEGSAMLSKEDDRPWLVFASRLKVGQMEAAQEAGEQEQTQEAELPIAAQQQSEMAGETLLSPVIHLQVTVEDTGIGMRTEEMDKLFEAFERVNLKETQSVQGAGLGLTLVSQLTRLMGGTVRAESVYGEGSVFTVDLPMRVVTDGFTGTIAEYEAQHAVQEGAAGQETILPDLSGRRLLVVDDAQVNLVVAKSLLEKTGAAVDTAMSGEEALDMAIAKHYDLIFLDHQMPGMDGVEAFKQLRAYGADGGKKNASLDTPVIALTANAGGSARVFYEEQGFDGYLGKPVREADLKKVLQSVLSV